MPVPLWRVEVGDNGAYFYGRDDGTTGAQEDYGSEEQIRRNAAAWKKQGVAVRIEHRQSPNHSWREAKRAQPERVENLPLFPEESIHVE